MEREQIRVVGISGSLRPGSFTKKAVMLALKGAQEQGAEIEYFDLATCRVACDGNTDDDGYPESVNHLRQTVKNAHGLIVGTPEYHGSFSGVLKNALDLMGFDEVQGKMIGLVSVAGGAMGGIGALASLRTIGRHLHAWVVPHQVAIPFASQAFDQNGELKDTKLRERVLEVGRQVSQFSYLHHSAAAQKFLKAWQEATPNPGGEHAF
ncbi:MAG: NAD(P)H-dependent oxidoreductase [Acidobacteria bacterium]|nr:NAD(P)H-dependent oxidoreductase [Acidobacteriota bacterium]